MKNHFHDYLLLLLLALIWSASFLLIKIAVTTIGPFTLTALRLTLAALIFCAFLLLKKRWIPMHRQAWILYIVIGMIGNTLPFILISQGEVYVDSSMAAVLMGIMPISTFFLAHFFVAEEPMSIRKVYGISLGFVGLITLVGLTALQGLGGHMFGQLAVLGGALSYSVTTIYVRRQRSSGFRGYEMAAGVTLFAALTSLPLAFVFERPFSMSPSVESLAAVSVLAVFATVVASLIYFRVIKQLGATIFAQINYVIPVLGSIWGVLILGERIEMKMILALVLVLCGIYFIQSKSARQQPTRGLSS